MTLLSACSIWIGYTNSQLKCNCIKRQRVSIARALVKDPHIILADEPTGALDSKTGEALVQTLKSLSKDKLVIVVTHDEEMALNYGDEIIEIKRSENKAKLVLLNLEKNLKNVEKFA